MTIEKRVKKHIWGKAQSLRVKPAAGLTDICLDQIRALLEKPIYPTKRSADLEIDEPWIYLRNIDFRSSYELLFQLSSARDLQIELFSKHCGSFGELTRHVSNFEWNLWIPANSRIKLSVDSRGSKLFHEKKIQLLFATELENNSFVVDQTSDAKEPLFRIHIQQIANRLSVYLSLAGLPLNQRGFKTSLRATASLREDIAASLLLKAKTGYLSTQIDNTTMILNPFAGSGSFLFEALQVLTDLNFAPFFRPYVLQLLSCHNPNTERFVLQNTVEKQTLSSKKLVLELEETHPEILSASKMSWDTISRHPKLEEILSQYQLNALDADSLVSKPQDPGMGQQHCLALLNPPYGLRVSQGSKSDDAEFYAQIAKRLNEDSKQYAELFGIILLVSDRSFQSFQRELKGRILGVENFNQGGLHTRALYFLMD